jgi:hypothetical protein
MNAYNAIKQAVMNWRYVNPLFKICNNVAKLDVF